MHVPVLFHKSLSKRSRDSCPPKRSNPTTVNFKLLPKMFMSTRRMPPFSHFTIQPCPADVSDEARPAREEEGRNETDLLSLADLDDDLDVLRGRLRKAAVLPRGRVQAADLRVVQRRHPGSMANPTALDRLLDQLHEIDP